ncbi:hypothetical protein Dacet_0646 [Denitrovibrio acetiphilus DSM 12809]|uniref:Lipoprotein n=1 Tax=Denitrovibrio acetiphilus (strain DSM 12809 / NBRC 114555 / N2460) TaxID=522772 RepID=D4H4P0_DENA2|nr:hypothetical protein [Denitrovibrio acetiphilus]ADD67434.1 hypothetical protein Dacet_0646 [Denitrovibrio acetiphilus DSM 12809]
MKKLILFLILVPLLQGCFSAVAGFQDGTSGGPIFSTLNWIKKSSVDYNEAMKEEIHDCLYYNNRRLDNCTDNTYVRSCGTDEFEVLELRYNCKRKDDQFIYKYYVKITTKDNKTFRDYSAFED